MNDEIFGKYVTKTKEGIEKLTPEEIKCQNQKMYAEYEVAYRHFRTKFDEGLCSYCNKPLKTFSGSASCLHWLLRPKGVKKKHIKETLVDSGYFDVDTYLRWVANTSEHLKSINDLKIDKKKLINTTIKHKHLEWSISCSPSDLKGHGNSNYPHFHFQFRIDKRPFVNFSDFHIRFTDHDLWRLAMQNQDEISYQYDQGYGVGMNDVLNSHIIEDVMKITTVCDSEDEAILYTDTLVMAKPGETISGSELFDLIEKSKQTGIPMSRLANELNANVTTYISEGKGVVDKAARTKTKRSK